MLAHAADGQKAVRFLYGFYIASCSAEIPIEIRQNKYKLYNIHGKIPLIFPEGEVIMQRVDEDEKYTSAFTAPVYLKYSRISMPGIQKEGRE